MRRFAPFPKSARFHQTVDRACNAAVESLERRTLLSTYTVTKVDSATYGAYGADDGSSGTLRWAVNQANADTSSSTINFASGLTGTITLTSGELQLNSGNITINGPGANQLTISGYVEQNNGSSTRLFSISSGVTASISNLSLTSGSAYNSDNTAEGGAIFNAGALSLTGVDISGNDAYGSSAVAGGPGLPALGGGIFSSGPLTILNSTISGNDAFGGNAGASQTNGANGLGGGIYATAALSLTNTIVTQNQVVAGAGHNGGTNGTSGGVGIYSQGPFTAYDSTIAFDSNGGNGIFLGSTGTSYNTIIQDAVSGNFDAASSSNLVDAAAGSYGLTSTTNIFSTSPDLAVTANYGGPFYSIEPGPNSPALAAGDITKIPAGISTDARGYARTINGKVDIGADQTTGFKLVFTQQPGNGSTNTTLPGVQVTLEDSNGYTVYDDSNPVTLSLNGPGTLTTGQAFFETGQETFSNLMINAAGIGDTLTASYPNVSSVTSAAFNITGVSTGYLYDAELTYLQPGQPQTGAAVLGSPTDPAWRSLQLSSQSTSVSGSIADTTGASTVSAFVFGSGVVTTPSSVPLVESGLKGSGTIGISNLAYGSTYTLVLYSAFQAPSFSIAGVSNGVGGSSPYGNYEKFTGLAEASGFTGPWSLTISFANQITGFQLQASAAVTIASTTVHVTGGTCTYGQGEPVSAYVVNNNTQTNVTSGTLTFNAQNIYNGSFAQSPALPLSSFANGIVSYDFGTQLGIATWTLTATYSGDSTHATSQAVTSLVVQQPVVAAPTTAHVTAGGPYLYRQDVNVSAYIVNNNTMLNVTTGTLTMNLLNTVTNTATTSPALSLSDFSNGQVSYDFGTSLGVGPYTLTVSYNGDSTNAASTASTSLTVNPDITTSIVLNQLTNPVIEGVAGIYFSAEVISSNPSYPGPPQGTVNFYDYGGLLGSATLDANGMAAPSLLFSTGASHNVYCSYVGSGIFDKSVSNAIYFTSAAPNAWSGGGGTSQWNNPANWSSGQIPSASDDVYIPAGYSVQVPAGTFNVHSLTLASPLEITNGATLILHDGSNINDGVTIDSGGNLQVQADPVLLSVTGLTINGSGFIDLGDNDLVVHGAVLANLSTQVTRGFNAGLGYWNGPGINSDSAAADSHYLTAVGLRAGGNPVDYLPTAASDAIVRYTYYGDANLDGKVDGSDYSLIDNGHLNGLTGWFNGDFNYDGVINGSDYTLIDNSFNRQSGTPSSAIAAHKSSTVRTTPTEMFSPSDDRVSMQKIDSVAAEIFSQTDARQIVLPQRAKA